MIYAASLISTSVSESLKNDQNSSYLAFDAIDKFRISIQTKISQLNDFIQQKKNEIADGEACMASKTKQFSDKSASLLNKTSTGNPSNNQAPDNSDCKKTLGSDPVGRKPSGKCPGIEKNCYWEEYTKIMQLVSFMPVVDVENLENRLFRYYPIGLQIPSPVGPLPTLASGIPDPMISVPMPIIWQHIISVSTPIGIFVTWVALTGVIPCPYLMYIDENMEACFLATLKGPISIPANSLTVTPVENKTLLETLPISQIFKVDLSSFPFNMISGNSSLKFNKDPDSGPAFMDKIKEKIHSAANGVPTLNWSLASSIGGLGPQGPQSSYSKTVERLNKALRQFPPDVNLVKNAMDQVGNAIDSWVDNMHISPIMIPKDPKKLTIPIVGPMEFIDEMHELIDQGISLSELGSAIKILSLRTELKKLIDRSITTPDILQQFNKIDIEILQLENSINQNFQGISSDIDSAVQKRVQKVKDILKIPVQSVADEISPELLNFVSSLSIPIPLPLPCYTAVSAEIVPPYILTVIEAIKALPTMIDDIPNDAFINVLQLDLTSPLPSVEDMIWFIVEAFLQFTPDLKFPDVQSCNLVVENAKTAIMNIIKTKIRMPHIAGIQIVVTEEMIKNLIKPAIKDGFSIIVNLVMQEIEKAVKTKDLEQIVAVALIIKALFGTDLEDISGNEIKALIMSLLDSMDSALSSIEELIIPFQALASDFKSIKETLFPDIVKLFSSNGIYFEISTEKMIEFASPLIDAIEQSPIPYPVILLGCASTPVRQVLTKLHPFEAKEMLPSWEKMSTKNLPFMIWLDSLVATAQKQGGFGSNYIAPYWLPDL